MMAPGYFNTAQFFQDLSKLNARLPGPRSMTPELVESCLHCSFAEFADFLSDLIGSEPRPAAHITHPDYSRSQRFLRAYRAAQTQQAAQGCGWLLVSVLDVFENYVAARSNSAGEGSA